MTSKTERAVVQTSTNLDLRELKRQVENLTEQKEDLRQKIRDADRERDEKNQQLISANEALQRLQNSSQETFNANLQLLIKVPSLESLGDEDRQRIDRLNKEKADLEEKIRRIDIEHESDKRKIGELEKAKPNLEQRIENSR